VELERGILEEVDAIALIQRVVWGSLGDSLLLWWPPVEQARGGSAQLRG